MFLPAAALPEGVKTLRKGAKVEYSVIDGRRGPQAMGVTLVASAPSLVKATRPKPDDMAAIVEDLINSSLQKRRIDRKNRDHSSKSQPCRKGYRMLFRNPHVKKTLREFLPEPVQSGSIWHSSSNSNYIFVILCLRKYCTG